MTEESKQPQALTDEELNGIAAGIENQLASLSPEDREKLKRILRPRFFLGSDEEKARFFSRSEANFF